MLEDIRYNFQRLVALYESEKQRADLLSEQLFKLKSDAEDYKKQITELNQQIDNLRLQSAFTASGDSAVAKDSINQLIREIDKCIRLLEK